MKRVLMTALFGVSLLVVLPANGFAQGRGHGHGKGWGDFDRDDKKCAKFVNCHDARDGRVDGRGPQRDTDRFRNVGNWRTVHERRHWNNGYYYDRQRWRHQRYLDARNRYWNRRVARRY